MIDLPDELETRAAPAELWVRFADVPIRIRANAPELVKGLAGYYDPYVAEPTSSPAAEVRLIEGPVRVPDGFADVRRVDGKRVKEAAREIPGWRLILKRATGVVMALRPGRAVAAGPLLANLNQVVNLINACYAQAVLGRGYLLLHASGVSWAERGAALCGPSGAGKSTAALHLVERGFRFLSNDRVMARAERDGVHALGYPKQPRVNPGTLLTHPRLHDRLDPGDAARLRAMEPSALWALERKCDVDLDAVYGKGTVALSARLRALVLVKWRLGGEGFAVRQLDATEAVVNLPLFYKDLGAFDVARPIEAERAVARLSEYAEVLERLTVVEVTGRPDFEALVDVVGDLLAK